jgi:hypothetical protein
LPDIHAQEVQEITGNPAKLGVGAVGGLLGQIILTLSIMEKNFNRQLTSKSSKSKKSAKSSKSAPKKESESAKKKEEEDAKSHKSGKSGKSAAISEPGEYNPLAEPSLKEKGWFTKQNVQGFLHYYIQDKMKNDKLGLAVS